MHKPHGLVKPNRSVVFLAVFVLHPSEDMSLWIGNRNMHCRRSWVKGSLLSCFNDAEGSGLSVFDRLFPFYVRGLDHVFGDMV
jgi:hypothetical protein